jgi:hypothetical protein
MAVVAATKTIRIAQMAHLGGPAMIRGIQMHPTVGLVERDARAV